MYVCNRAWNPSHTQKASKNTFKKQISFFGIPILLQGREFKKKNKKKKRNEKKRGKKRKEEVIKGGGVKGLQLRKKKFLYVLLNTNFIFITKIIFLG